MHPAVPRPRHRRRRRPPPVRVPRRRAHRRPDRRHAAALDRGAHASRAGRRSPSARSTSSLSSLTLVALAPLLIGVAIAIKLDSRGPVLFVQRRSGRGGRFFALYKFRSMYVDATVEVRQDGAIVKHVGDDRITRVGRFIRRFSLDEAPQFLNVLKGDMSLVGPRPLVEEEAAVLSDWQERRADLRPGLTGPWQISGRSHIPLPGDGHASTTSTSPAGRWPATSRSSSRRSRSSSRAAARTDPRAILHVTEASAAGTLQVVRTLAARQAASGHVVTLAYADRPETPADLRGDRRRGRGARSRCGWARRSPFSQLAAGRALRRLVRERSPDIVHLHSSFAGAVGALSLPRAVTLIYTPHGLAFVRTGVRRANRATVRAVESLVARRCALLGAVSEAEATLARDGLHAPRVAVVRNGIPELDGEPVAPTERAEPVVVATGRIAAQRRPAATARILAALAPAARVSWIGGGEDDAPLREAGIPVTGWLPREQALARLAERHRLRPLVGVGRPVARDPRGDRARRRRRRLRHPGEPRGARRAAGARRRGVGDRARPPRARRPGAARRVARRPAPPRAGVLGHADGRRLARDVRAHRVRGRPRPRVPPLPLRSRAPKIGDDQWT